MAALAITQDALAVPTANKESARKHVALLTGDASTPCHFRLWRDDKKAGVIDLFGTVDALWEKFERLQREGYGVFIVVNEGGRTDAEITRIRAAFVDFDDVALPDHWHLPPGLITGRSRTRAQAYWFVDDMPVEMFRNVQKRLSAYYGTDSTACNPSRLMRLAGTLHQKGKPVPYDLMMVPDEPTRQNVDSLVQGLPDVSSQEPKPKGAVILPFINTPRMIRHAIEYLTNAAPTAVQGSGGDTATLNVATQLGDIGCSEGKAFELMLEHWNEQKADPPWPPDDLKQKVRNAYRYRKSPVGCDAAENVFEPIDVSAEKPAAETAATEPPEKPKIHFEMFNDIQIEDAPPPLIDGVFCQDSEAVIFGDTHAGKTFVALSMAYHITTGRKWNDRQVNRGAVVYFAAEAGGTIKKRFVALREYYKDQNVPLALVPCPIDLSGKGPDLKPILQIVREVEAKTGVPVVAIFIDTLSRAIAGGDENSSEDMGAFVTNMGRLRHATKALVVAVHHSGKTGGKGERGHSLLKCNMDTRIEIEKGEHDGKGKLIYHKVRDEKKPRPDGFVLEVVNLGKDNLGRDVTSCVALPQKLMEVFAPIVRPTSAAGKALRVLQDLTLSNDEDRWLEIEEWRDAFVNEFYPDKEKSGRSIFGRARKNLLKTATIEVSGNSAKCCQNSW